MKNCSGVSVRARRAASMNSNEPLLAECFASLREWVETTGTGQGYGGDDFK